MSNNLIKCPHCGKDIEVTEVLTHSIRESMRNDMQAELAKKEKDFAQKDILLKQRERELAQQKEAIDEQIAVKLKEAKQKQGEDALKKAREELGEQAKALQSELDEKNQKLADAQEKERQLRKQAVELEEKQKNLDLELDRRLDEEKAKITEQVRNEAVKKANSEFAAKSKAIEEELAEKNAKLADAQKKELELRKQQRQLEERQANMELELVRKLDEERSKIAETAMQKAADDQQLKMREKDDLIKSMQVQMEHLQRKMELGSQEAQGEALEGSLKDKLSQLFPFDIFEDVKKAVRGADIFQRVRNNTGKECGMILWEAKNAQNFSKDWITKLKGDQKEAGADIAVIATVTLPKEIGGFGIMDDVWVTDYKTSLCLAMALRHGLINVAREKMVVANQSTVKDIVYRYVTSQEFTLQIKAVVAAFERMRDDLESEKRAMQKYWKSREKQIETVLGSVSNIYGAIEGYVGQKQLPQIDPLMLESMRDEESS